jgi:hypothetical protein
MASASCWLFTSAPGLVTPIYLLELALTNPSYRQNVATFALRGSGAIGTSSGFTMEVHPGILDVTVNRASAPGNA